jgi:hypothetical protein
MIAAALRRLSHGEALGVTIFCAVAISGLAFYLILALRRRSIRLIMRGKTEVYKRDTDPLWYWYTWIVYFGTAILLVFVILEALHSLWPNIKGSVLV